MRESDINQYVVLDSSELSYRLGVSITASKKLRILPSAHCDIETGGCGAFVGRFDRIFFTNGADEILKNIRELMVSLFEFEKLAVQLQPYLIEGVSDLIYPAAIVGDLILNMEGGASPWCSFYNSAIVNQTVANALKLIALPEFEARKVQFIKKPQGSEQYFELFIKNKLQILEIPQNKVRTRCRICGTCTFDYSSPVNVQIQHSDKSHLVYQLTAPFKRMVVLHELLMNAISNCLPFEYVFRPLTEYLGEFETLDPSQYARAHPRVPYYPSRRISRW